MNTMMNAKRVDFVTTRKFKSQGFSLVELMVALAAGLIVSSAVVAFLMSSFKSNAEYVQSTRLTQELRNTLDLAVRDLERAGYDDNALAYMGTNNVSPFSPMCIWDPSTSACSAVVPSAAGNCIIYAYDRTFLNGSSTASGTAGTLDLSNGEVRGLRLKSATVNGLTVGAIEYGTSASSTRPACNGAAATYTTYPASCNTTSKWCPLSDASKLDITAFTITNNGPASLTGSGITMLTRRLDVTLSGRLAGTTDTPRTVRTSIKVRSDCVRPIASFGNCSLSP
jgi:prepilin-type N-terminal cleavage/methylation domain-containing protein